MNERIRELAKKSGLIQYDSDSKIIDIKKFTEMMIDESISVMIKHDYHGEWLGEKLKQHFDII